MKVPKSARIAFALCVTAVTGGAGYNGIEYLAEATYSVPKRPEKAVSSEESGLDHNKKYKDRLPKDKGNLTPTP